MFKRLWLGFLFLLVLVSLTSFVAVNAAAYPNPFSCTGNTDSSLALAQGLAPPVMDKTFVYDAKMESIDTAFATSGDEDNGLLPNTADTTDGGRYQNVAMNRFEADFSGNWEVAHPSVLVCEFLATYGYYTTPNFAQNNGQNIDYDNRSPLPEVVYIGNMSGPGDGEAYFAITCEPFAPLPDIGDPVYQASWPTIQTRSATPEVVYLGNQSPAGDSNFSPIRLGNEFAIVCDKLIG